MQLTLTYLDQDHVELSNVHLLLLFKRQKKKTMSTQWTKTFCSIYILKWSKFRIK